MLTTLALSWNNIWTTEQIIYKIIVFIDSKVKRPAHLFPRPGERLTTSFPGSRGRKREDTGNDVEGLNACDVTNCGELGCRVDCSASYYTFHEARRADHEDSSEVSISFAIFLSVSNRFQESFSSKSV